MDLAEVLGTILGLNLLFGLPLLWGCVITVFDTFLLLAIQRLGIRKMEAFTNRNWVKVLAWTIAVIIIGLNSKLVYDEIAGWLSGGAPTWLGVTAVIVSVVLAVALIYITVLPFFRGRRGWALRWSPARRG